MSATTILNDATPHVRTKLAVLWAAVTLCYLYGDVIGLFRPGGLQLMLDGKMGFWPVTQPLLLAMSIVMSTPPIMAVLTILARPGLARWLNVVFGAAQSLLMLFTMIDAARFGFLFYLYFGVVEVMMTGLIVWIALRWPRSASDKG